MNFSFCIWLTYEEAVLDSPFETASIGYKITVPDEDAVIIRGRGDNWRNWYKVNLIQNDTTLFLDSLAFNLKGNDLYVSSLEFSNDAKMLLVRTDFKPIWRYSYSATYYLYDLMNKKLFPLSDENKDLRNVKFAPTSDRIAYVRQDNNIYVYDIKRDRERRLTTSGSEFVSNGHFGWLYEEELTGFDAYRWSPDGKSICYWEEDNSMVKDFSIIDDLAQYPTITKIKYPKAGETNPTLKIGVLRVSGAGKRWLDSAYVNNDYLSWMEWIDNERIAFLKLKRNQKSWDLFVSNRNTGKSVKVLAEEDKSGWLENDGQIKFLDDGKIIWISEKTGYRHLWMSKHSGSKTWPITQGKWEVSKIIKVDEEKDIVYFMANQESVFEERLYSIRFDGTETKLLSLENGHHTISLTGSGDFFIDSYSTTESPKKIVLKELTGGGVIRVLAKTDLEQFKRYRWSPPKIVQFKSIDGSTFLDGIITLPPNYDDKERYPVIVHGYGMPGTQKVWNKWGSTWDQYLAQQGYIIFSMDSRGMSGRGEEFKNLSYGDMSKYLALDHIAGVNYLIDSGYADENRIGAWGSSGGGYFTCLMLTKNAQYFKAGVAIAPCTDFRLYDTAYTERSMGMPERNKAGYDSTNVINWIHRMEGKILLMHGSADDNVHSQHTIKFVQAALRADKDVEWYLYPNRNHGIYGGGARKHLYKKMIEFFNENL